MSFSELRIMYMLENNVDKHRQSDHFDFIQMEWYKIGPVKLSEWSNLYIIYIFSFALHWAFSLLSQ